MQSEKTFITDSGAELTLSLHYDEDGLIVLSHSHSTDVVNLEMDIMSGMGYEVVHQDELHIVMRHRDHASHQQHSASELSEVDVDYVPF